MTTTTSYGTWYSATASSSPFEADCAEWAESGTDLYEEVNAALPEGVVMLGNGDFIGPAYGYDMSGSLLAFLQREVNEPCEVCGREAGWLHDLVHRIAAGI